jgi:putative tricarboxylic transport membrane protein
MEALSYLAMGLGVALQPINLLYCFLGVFCGTLVGVLPGIGPSGAIALLLPITLLSAAVRRKDKFGRYTRKWNTF